MCRVVARQTVKGGLDWSTEYKESTKTHNFMMTGNADLDVTGTKGTIALTLNSLETPRLATLVPSTPLPAP